MSPVPPLLRDRRLWWLVGLAALLRLVVGLHQWSADPTMAGLLSDSLYYQAWATDLAGGADFAGEGPGLPYWMPPLYPRLLALVGGSVGAMLLVQGLLGLVTTVLVVALTEALLEATAERRSAALWSGLLATLFAPVIFFEGRLLGASLATLLATAALLLLARGFVALTPERRPRLAWLAAAGLVTGLLALVRPNTLLAVPAVAAWLLVRGRRSGLPLTRSLPAAALFGLAALLPLLPALAHNHAAEGELIPITANGGINFHFGNNPSAHGTFHAPGPEWGSIETQRSTSLALACEAEGRPLTPGEASRYWFDRGASWLADEPGAALRLWGLKLADSLSSTELGIQYNLAAARHRAPSLWLLPIPFGALLLLAALGWSRRDDQRPGARGLCEAWLAAGLASALLYFTYSRFRLPLLPALLPLCGLGMVRLLARRVSPLALGAGLLLLVASFVPFEGSYPRHLESHAYSDMAGALEATPATRPERAELYARALELVPGNKPAALGLAVTRIEAAAELPVETPAGTSAAAAALAALEAAAAIPVDFPSAEYQLAHFLANWPDPGIADRPRALAIVRAWLATSRPTDPARPAFEDLAQSLTAGP
ncbi:MAG: hypothetical protein P1V81_00045 [Planctomycetota bacterium]|nr:hypothetical protein [Planctomycetota bacterium]